MAASMKVMKRAGTLNIIGKITCGRNPFASSRCYYSSQLEFTPDEMIDDAHYPEIQGKYPPGEWGDFPRFPAWNIHKKSNELKAIPTAKERLESIAGSRNFYMTKCKANESRPNTLFYKKYITKTNVLQGLPHIYQDINVTNALSVTKSSVQDAILCHSEHLNSNLIERKQSDDRQLQYDLHEYLGKLIASIMNSLSIENEHLLTSQMDEAVQVQSYWLRGGYANIVEGKIEKLKVRGNWCGVLNMQYQDLANYQIRTELPAPEFIAREDILSKGTSVDCDIVPNSYGQLQVHNRPTNVAGHWIGDPCEWGLLSFYTMRENDFRILESHGKKTHSSMLHDLAVVSGFGSSVAQAHNQGFSSYLELTYPITTQTIAYGSTGEFYICAYQLNTLELFKDDLGNPYQNLAWISGPHKLYDTVEDGQVKGFNEDTLELLLKCFLLKPVERDINLRPYLPLEESPLHTNPHINYKGEPPIERAPIGRFQYPRNSKYFQ